MLPSPIPPDKSGYLQVHGADIFFREIGSGTPLVVLHGGPGLSQDYLYPHLAQLLAKDYRLFFYDQRASGHSSGSDKTSLLTMAQFVADLEEIRQAIGLETLNLLGHSFGGLLAMFYAIEYPARVNKLILLDSDAASWALRTPYQQQIIAERLTKHDRQVMMELEALPGAQDDPEIMEQIFRVSLRPYFHDPSFSQHLPLGFDETALQNYYPTSRLVRQDLGHYDIHPELHNISAATLIIHGTTSIFSVEGAKTIHQYLPNSELVLLKEVGHFAYLEAPQMFKNTLKEFI